MKLVIPAIAIAMLVGTTTFAPAAEPPSALGTPRSVQLQHEQIVGRLESIAKRGSPAGAAAAKAATFLKAHYAKEEEYVLPPLGLLPGILKTPNPADLSRALAMAARTKAALNELLDDHERITSMMNGVHCQTSAITMDSVASVGSVSHGVEGTPKLASAQFTMP